MRRLWWLGGEVKEKERKIGNDSIGLLHRHQLTHLFLTIGFGF